MEKIKVLGIKKGEHRSEYSFPKEEKVLRVMRVLSRELGFDEQEVSPSFAELDYAGDLSNIKDEIICFYCDKYSVDMVFFSNEIALVFHYKEDLQNEIAEVLNKYILEEE